MPSLITDIKSAITAVTDPIEQGEAWLRQVVDEHLPALATAAGKLDALEKSPIGEVVEAVLSAGLGTEAEQDIADVIAKLASMASRGKAPDREPVQVPASPAVPVTLSDEGAASVA